MPARLFEFFLSILLSFQPHLIPKIQLYILFLNFLLPSSCVFLSLLLRTLLFYSAILWCVPHLILLHIHLLLFIFVLRPVCLLSLYISFLFSFSENLKLLLLLNLFRVIFSFLHFSSIFLSPLFHLLLSLSLSLSLSCVCAHVL